MPRRAQSVVPDLPGDVQWQIVQQLSTRDVCSAAMASKAFSQWLNALTHLEAATTVRRQQAKASLSLFMGRRVSMGLKVKLCSSIQTHCRSTRVAGLCVLVAIRLGPELLQVETMHLYFYRFGQLPATKKNMFKEMLFNTEFCSATLTELCLEGLSLEHFEDFTRRTHATGCDLKVTAALRLIVTYWFPDLEINCHDCHMTGRPVPLHKTPFPAHIFRGT